VQYKKRLPAINATTRGTCISNQMKVEDEAASAAHKKAATKIMGFAHCVVCPRRPPSIVPTVAVINCILPAAARALH
jgi:hypothetical protein